MEEVRGVSRFLRPERYCSSVLSLDPRRLAQQGVKALLFDLDNTILARGESGFRPEIRAWIDGVRACGLECFIVSNSAKPRVRAKARELSWGYVENAHKPFSSGCLRAASQLQLAPEQCLMVGDQSWTDVLGAHNAGMPCALVQPLGPQDLWYTRILRVIDRFATLGMVPEPPLREA